MRLLFFLIGLYIFYQVVKKKFLIFFDNLFEKKNEKEVFMVQDPVCGIYITKNQALKKNIKGRSFYFCSQECKKKFE